MAEAHSKQASQQRDLSEDPLPLLSSPSNENFKRGPSGASFAWE